MVKQVTVHEAWEAVRERGAVLVDVRELHEWNEMRAVGARHIPLSELEGVLAARALPSDVELLFICASGNRSQVAVLSAMERSYAAVANVDGGTVAWFLAGLPVERSGS